LSIKDMIDLLSPFERKTAMVLGLLALVSVLFFLMVPLNKRAAYNEFQQTATRSERRMKQVEADSSAKKRDIELWEQAEIDIETLRGSYLYTKDMPSEMRLDVEKILRENGIRTPSIEYEYEDYPAVDIKRVRMNFTVDSAYYGLRKVIHAFETYPKLLVLERIEFLDIDERGVSIRVRLRLAGFYEQNDGKEEAENAEV
jgi:hypothetical protein